MAERAGRWRAIWSWAGPTLASVVLFALAFPPAGLSLLVFVALVPWLAALKRLDPKTAAKSGALFGAVTFLFQMFWLLPFVSRWTGKLGSALVPWFVCAFLAGVIYMALGWALSLCWRSGRAWAIPFVWSAHEAARAYLPVLAFPWAIAAQPLWPFAPFVQTASIGTIFLVSAWVLLPNVVGAMFLAAPKGEPPPGQRTFRFALVFVAGLMLSVIRFSQPVSGQTRAFTLGQPGVDMAFLPQEEEERQIEMAGKLIAARAAEQGTDLLVFPEGFAQPSPNVPPPSPLGPAPAVPVVFGGKRVADGVVYQTAFSFDGEWRRADKTRLVVFGEYVPFRDLPFMASFNLPAGDLSPARDLRSLDCNGMRLGPMLCFEGLFPDLPERHQRLGAQVLVQMSIDDWYEDSPAHAQLWQSSVWRSIESGMPLVRVGGRGQSLATNARGEIVATVPIGKMDARRVLLKVPDQPDGVPYRTLFVFLAGAVSLGIVAEHLWKSWRKPG